MAGDKAKSLKLLIGAGILLVLMLLYIGYTYLSSQNDSTGYAKLKGVNTNSVGKDIPESENYKEILQEYNEIKADDAIDKGKSYISVLSGEEESLISEKTKTEEKKPPKKSPEPPPEPKKPSFAPVMPKQTQQKVYKVENKNLMAQTQALMNSWNNPTTHATARVSDDSKKYVESITTIYEENKENYTFNQDELDKIVDDYEVVPAILKTEIDSDENSVVRAFVPNGKYKGAWLFADGYKLLYENIDMTFTRMVLGGETYNIVAKPLDEKTMRTTLSGKVNTRWFQKIILPAIANGVGEVSDLYKNSNRKILQNGFNTYESTGGLPKGESIAGVMIGGAGSRMAKTIEKESNTLSYKEVVVSNNTVIGIQFIGPVYKSDSIDYKKSKDSVDKSSINNAAMNSTNSLPQMSSQYNSNYYNDSSHNDLPVNNY